MNIWSYISDFGFNKALSAEEQRRIRLLVRLNFISAGVLIIYIVAQAIISIFTFLPAIALMLVFIVLDLFLVKLNSYQLAKHFAVITVSSSISFFCLTTGDTYFEALFIPLITVPLIIFGSRYTSIGYFIYMAILIVAVKYSQESITPLLKLNPRELFFFKTLNIVTAGGVTYFITFYFKSANEQYEKKLIEMHDTVAEKNKEITDSIQYAKRIQESLMPKENYIEKKIKSLLNK